MKGRCWFASDQYVSSSYLYEHYGEAARDLFEAFEWLTIHDLLYYQKKGIPGADENM